MREDESTLVGRLVDLSPAGRGLFTPLVGAGRLLPDMLLSSSMTNGGWSLNFLTGLRSLSEKEAERFSPGDADTSRLATLALLGV